MASSVSVTNNGASYLIGGSTTNRNIGANTYTFTGVPSNHPMKLVPHGTYATPCNPTLVSATYTTAQHHYGTVVYDFSSCTSAPVALEFQCGYHGSMSLGAPILTVKSAC